MARNEVTPKVEKLPCKLVFTQIIDMLLLAIQILPNLLFNSAVNAMTKELELLFDNTSINSNSYTITAVPSVFALIVFSILMDIYGTNILMPVF